MRELDRREALRLMAVLGASMALPVAGCAAGDGQGDAGDASADGSAGDDQAAADAGTILEADPDDPYATGVHHAAIEVEGYGTIEVALNANVAPVTVSNFCHLVEEGFYDGLTFHRIIPGFMIQGGDPNGDGTGGSDRTIKGEFSANGVENNIPHVRGTISMARASDYDSASSQFFIVHETSESNSASLDGNYAAFGNATSGMDVVDAICESVPTQDSNGTVAAADQPRIARVTLTD